MIHHVYADYGDYDSVYKIDIGFFSDIATAESEKKIYEDMITEKKKIGCPFSEAEIFEGLSDDDCQKYLDYIMNAHTLYDFNFVKIDSVEINKRLYPDDIY